MNPTVRLLIEAEADIDEAMRWYDDQSRGQGQEFLRQIEACVDRIRNQPTIFPLVKKPIRRAVAKRFPYCVYFVPGDVEIVILAVIHGRRDPGVWRRRTEP